MTFLRAQIIKLYASYENNDNQFSKCNYNPTKWQCALHYDPVEEAPLNDVHLSKAN
jgi:hypothetical protein